MNEHTRTLVRGLSSDYTDTSSIRTPIIEYTDISFGPKIGQGAFGDVKKGM